MTNTTTMPAWLGIPAHKLAQWRREFAAAYPALATARAKRPRIRRERRSELVFLHGPHGTVKRGGRTLFSRRKFGGKPRYCYI